jgi:hypothetical protein
MREDQSDAIAASGLLDGRRAKASSVAGSVTTPFCIADSSPPEKAKPPIGNTESPN